MPEHETNFTANNQRLGPVSLQRRSHNSKLAEVQHVRFGKAYHTHPKPPFVASTYVSIDATCPSTCRFKGSGCYVQSGSAVGPMRRLDKAAEGITGTEVNRLEAELIDKQWSSVYHRNPRVPQDGPGGTGRPLRLHVGGDVAGNMGAEYLSFAANRWLRRGGGPVWTFTHRWRKVWRERFGQILALASVETAEEAEHAVDLGYTPAYTTERLDDDRMFRLGDTGVRVIPCPAQTRGRTCVDCQLCLRRLQKGVAIGFALHGRGKGVAARKLEVIQ